MSEAAPSAPGAESLMAQLADEFLERVNAGERPDVEEYARRHPEVAGFVRQMFPALLLLRVPPTEPGSPGEEAEAEAAGRGCLGDFRIVREVGRGGMGVVYQAEQVSLGRRVALKVLPFASALDERQLARFRNEAQAAAGLHHSNIVPVHAVGCERGVHYYAMQFIDGHTLAEVISALRRQSEPGQAAAGAETAGAHLTTLLSAGKGSVFEAAARWGEQAARALEHAHGLGVVHRDVKPANLMLDGRGDLWVTDFGLAHRGDAGLTLTGDLVGTLRYMSPSKPWVAAAASITARTSTRWA